MAEEKPIAIFRTREEMLKARDLNNIIIPDKILYNSIFASAKMTETLGFMIKSGSDYTVIDVKKIQNDPKAFLELAFGERGGAIGKKDSL